MTILFTGGTGFVGSTLTRKLLNEQEKDVVLLVRKRERAMSNYILQREKILHGRRLGIAIGDITEPDLGLDDDIYDALIKNVSEIWHCAASVTFREKFRDSTFKANLGGTQSMIEFATKCPKLKKFHYVSTAYTHGNQEGTIQEDPHIRPESFKNPYEESKYEAENLVRKSNLPFYIFKPSIIIGDSKTAEAASTVAYYGYLMALKMSFALYSRQKEKNEENKIIRLRGKDGTKNHIAIDQLTDIMFKISKIPAGLNRAYHITNPVQGKAVQITNAINRVLGSNFQYVENLSSSDLNSFENFAAKYLQDYQSYMDSDDPVLDMTNTFSMIGDDYSFHPSDEDFLYFLFSKYSEQINWDFI